MKEFTEGAKAGVDRTVTNAFGQVKQKEDFPSIGGNKWACDIASAIAEVAFAKFIGEDWIGGVNTFHKPDVAPNWQVRYTDNPNGCLIVRPKENSKFNDRYVLVKGTKITKTSTYIRAKKKSVTVDRYELTPDFRIAGWMLGGDAIKDKYLKNPNGQGEAYFVPEKDLIKFSESKAKALSTALDDSFDF